MPGPVLDDRLEASGLWPDFHTVFVVNLRTHLTRALRPTYTVLAEERVYVAWEDVPPRPVRPDATVTPPRSSESKRKHAATARGVALAPSVERAVPVPDEVREPFVVVRGRDGRVVAVVESLSPNNKRAGHPGRSAYLQKREALLASETHLVEIDLLREGERTPLVDGWPPCTYAVVVARGDRRPLATVYPVQTGEPLPRIAFPLAPGDADLPLDLQEIFERTWIDGDYEGLLEQG
ncbi:DUF4058 family protein [Limnochorda pilosa]|uniref:DUF4058 family protein n=1 Tax=Limnochorda pilosa TaxID=1555112 RepID=A0A0K2SIV2_LIMPI|nr:DUF4058 family protein [Limnochorda pilosa]BAS27056.1 hypothetical protein LIP_1199 [Limnochorda pilosa]